jgi:uncharacterized membrane protein
MRAVRVLIVAAVVTALGGLLPGASLAQAALSLTTPYPSVAVQPGQSVTFDLLVTAAGRQRVDLAVASQPDGWEVKLRGGGFEIDGVFTDPDTPPDANAEVQVPAEAAEGTYQVSIRGTAQGATATLDLQIRVAASVENAITLTTDFPSQQGDSSTTFTFNLELSNNTPEEATFSFDASGPEGWQVSARPSGQTTAATVSVAGGSSSTITVDADPPDDVPAGQYEVTVAVNGTGGRSAQIPLQVEITGSFSMSLTTPDQRLNAEAVAGRASTITLLVVNDGTAPLTDVSLSSSPPTDWEITFEPENVAQVAPGANARVQATITPAGDAVAGDYVLTITANSADVSESVDIRTTVKTSSFWGLIGILLILAAFGGLVYVFRRYGRR